MLFLSLFQRHFLPLCANSGDKPIIINTQVVKEIEIKDFQYTLPDDTIAKYPLTERNQSKLLVWKNGAITDDRFYNLSSHLHPGSLLVFNNTKVIRARLHFRKATGAKIEIFCLDPVDPVDYAINFSQTSSCTWKCIVGNQKKWKEGILIKKLNINGTTVTLKAERKENEGNTPIICFSWDNRFSFSEVLETAGIIPIPPYLNRETEPSDIERYQTVYSRIKGSVAAPTAGLHFTNDTFSALAEKEIECAEVTLHVGAGTFQPVKTATIDEHEMHTEHILVTRELLQRLIDKRGPLIAVGTTSIRTLESLYWMGAKVYHNKLLPVWELKVNQWEPYQDNFGISYTEALAALIGYMDANNLPFIDSATQIIIVPGYTFQVIDGMITNFHQPQSTLLLLISAFLGDNWKDIYQHALKNGYRFLSYGDSNLYLK